MVCENLVGLNIIDEQRYQAYREGMLPILQRYGGGFGYDFKVAKTLKAATDAPINRVFTIYFPDEASMNAFFTDAAYLAVKQQHFEPAVTDTTIIASYQR